MCIIRSLYSKYAQQNASSLIHSLKLTLARYVLEIFTCCLVCVVWMLRIVEPPGVFLNNLKLPFVTSPICFSCLCQFAGCLLFFVFFSYSTIFHLMLNQTTKSIQLFNKFDDENTMHFGKITWNRKYQPFF